MGRTVYTKTHSINVYSKTTHHKPLMHDSTRFHRYVNCAIHAMNIIGASLSETHMMRSMGIFSVCLSVRSHAVYTRVLIQRYNACANFCAKFFSHVVCTCACMSEFDEYEVHGLHLRTRINQFHHRSL